MKTALWVAAGSGIGGMARVLLAAWTVHWLGADFPYGVMAVNVLGSFAIGLAATLTAPDGRIFVSAPARQFFLAGICGGFTTFSFFSLQTMQLLENGDWLKAVVYAAGTVLFSMLAVALGHIGAGKINAMRRR